MQVQEKSFILLSTLSYTFQEILVTIVAIGLRFVNILGVYYLLFIVIWEITIFEDYVKLYCYYEYEFYMNCSFILPDLRQLKILQENVAIKDDHLDPRIYRLLTFVLVSPKICWFSDATELNRATEGNIISTLSTYFHGNFATVGPQFENRLFLSQEQ